ncbi:CoA-binding protein [Cokeromyces recurvatus]|uniref:CoA-binding protein n=1 Tax=Cokeromyces recurvatus TaxID=90255 RepID=UPI0022207399|nr:CoA-binding protein [Cokeromyces recurvatus]KAI7899039.1 CoA-binding protein [Cokeromyces recurvatus]
MSSMSHQFLKNPYFAVVGASTSREKFGNRVLRWYQSNHLNVTPIHPKEHMIEGLTTKASIHELPYPSQTSLSIVTPPAVTLHILQEAYHLGFRYFWLQPGAEDDQVRAFATTHKDTLHIILGGPCILVDGPKLLKQKL